MKTKFETGICANCGADFGLHQSETNHCPKGGREENRFNELTGKFYPQQWQNTTFEDSGIKKLHQAAPDMLEALIKMCDYHEKMSSWDKGDNGYYKAKQAIKKATE